MSTVKPECTGALTDAFIKAQRQWRQSVAQGMIEFPIPDWRLLLPSENEGEDFIDKLLTSAKFAKSDWILFAKTCKALSCWSKSKAVLFVLVMLSNFVNYEFSMKERLQGLAQECSDMTGFKNMELTQIVSQLQRKRPMVYSGSAVHETLLVLVCVNKGKDFFYKKDLHHGEDVVVTSASTKVPLALQEVKEERAPGNSVLSSL